MTGIVDLVLPEIFRFGLWCGARNLLVNGFRLGRARTIGKLLQPINSYTRFPEYSEFIQQFRRGFVQSEASGFMVFDLGSPKLLGMFLAYRFPIHVVLSDISRQNLDQFRIMWHAIASRAEGNASFLQMDGRFPSLKSKAFDFIYAMSVLEHVSGDHQDVHALEKLLGRLKPSGSLVISIPYGTRYMEQQMIGVKEGGIALADEEAHFFQRVYDHGELKTRFLDPMDISVAVTTVKSLHRRNHIFTVGYHNLRNRLGQAGKAVLGAFYPLVSALANTTEDGLTEIPVARTRGFVSLWDIYSDVVITYSKSPQGSGPRQTGVELGPEGEDETSH
jgi:2-polyprenyl-3-methyl-5-hydroxy-6-metoxy-1,4-benzoquinol methylase